MLLCAREVVRGRMCSRTTSRTRAAVLNGESIGMLVGEIGGRGLGSEGLLVGGFRCGLDEICLLPVGVRVKREDCP